MNLENLQIDDVKKSTTHYIRQHYLPWVIGYCILVLLTCWVVYVSGTLQLFFVDVIVGVFGYSYVYSRVEAEFVKEFGAAIGYEYSATASMDTVSGKLFQVGGAHSIINVLTGTYQGIPSRIYSYGFTVGSGKDSHRYTYTVFEATFPNTMPDIFLASSNDGYDMRDFFGTEPLKLESNDFNKAFSVRVSKGYETEVYEILTPDVMANLIDKVSHFNFEFNQNKLYIYSTHLITTKADMQKAFDLTDYLLTLFKRNISEMPVSAGNENGVPPAPVALSS